MSERVLVAPVLTIIGVSASSLRRLIKEDGFPKPEKVGGVHYFKTHLIYKWLGKKSGRNVAIGDKLLSAKDIERLFKRSPVWFWIYFIKNKSRKAKIIKIRSKNMWLASEIHADKELQKYLKVVSKEVV
jgi:predicted DNA-binding transcriptional regulator AlpA